MRGEGHHDAARRLRPQQERFVQDAERVERKAQLAEPDRPAQARELEDAERAGRAKAKRRHGERAAARMPRPGQAKHHSAPVDDARRHAQTPCAGRVLHRPPPPSDAGPTADCLRWLQRRITP